MRPKAYGYACVSADDSMEIVDEQMDQIRRYWQARRPDVKLVGLHEPLLVDEDQSVPILERPNGRQLIGLRQGDHVIVTSLDSGFRNTRDAIDTYEKFERYGISLHVIDLQLDTSTTLGRLVFANIAAAADFDRRRLSERMKGVNRLRSGKGLPVACGGSVAIGWKHAPGETKTKLWVVDNEVRDDCVLIHQLHDDEGMSYEKIYNSFWQHGNKRRRDGSEWSLSAIKRHHAAYKRGYPMQGRGEALVADHATREAGEDRGEGYPACKIRDVPTCRSGDPRPH